MIQQKMTNLVFSHWNDAKEIFGCLPKSSEDKYNLNIVYEKQYNLMVDILEKRQLYTIYTIDELIKNTILSIMDEINEFSEWSNTNTPKLYSDIEQFFELIDILHFIVQLDILVYAKSIGLGITDLTIKNKSKILNEILPKNFDDIVLLPNQTSLSIQLSEILGELHWKHWKTYNKEIDYPKLQKNIDIFIKMLINICMVFVYPNDIIIGYIIKNYENFQRQLNGY